MDSDFHGVWGWLVVLLVHVLLALEAAVGHVATHHIWNILRIVGVKTMK